MLIEEGFREACRKNTKFQSLGYPQTRIFDYTDRILPFSLCSNGGYSLEQDSMISQSGNTL